MFSLTKKEMLEKYKTFGEYKASGEILYIREEPPLKSWEVICQSIKKMEKRLIDV